MSLPKTTVIPALWPHTPYKENGKKSAARTVRQAQIDTGEELAVCDDPPPSSTLGPRGSKYAAIFEALPVGKGLICSKEKASVVAAAMRTWIKNTGRVGVGVSAISDYGDGKGRVWLVKKDDK